MSDNALSEIIAVEKEIQAKVREEQDKALEWLESESKKNTEQSSEQLARYQEHCQKLIVEAEEQALNEADQVIKSAEKYKSLLEGLQENQLKQCLRKHLSSILPEVPS